MNGSSIGSDVSRCGRWSPRWWRQYGRNRRERWRDGGTVTIMSAGVTSVGSTGNQDIDGLLYGTKWTGTVTFSFPDARSDYPTSYSATNEPNYGFGAISAAQQVAATAVMAMIEAYTLLEIDYAGTGSADIMIAKSSKASPTAYAYLPGSGPGGDVWFGTSYDYSSPKLGNYSYVTMIHELGHSFGLKHGQETGGVANVALPANHDGLEYSVMTYRSYVGGPTTGYTNETYGFPQTYMMNDILALQTLYGADYTTNATDSVYTWSPTTGEMFIDGVGQGQPGGTGAGASANRVFLTIWDGGGNDTYDMSNYTTGVAIDLNPGGYSLTSAVQLAYLGGGNYAHGNVYNAYLYNNDARSYIENAIGGSGADTLIGNAVANRLDGGTGNDTLTGGGDGDTFVYAPGYGADVVTDFGADDKIDLTAFDTVYNLSGVLALATQERRQRRHQFRRRQHADPQQCHARQPDLRQLCLQSRAADWRRADRYRPVRHGRCGRLDGRHGDRRPLGRRQCRCRGDLHLFPAQFGRRPVRHRQWQPGRQRHAQLRDCDLLRRHGAGDRFRQPDLRQDLHHRPHQPRPDGAQRRQRCDQYRRRRGDDRHGCRRHGARQRSGRRTAYLFAHSTTPAAASRSMRRPAW